MLKNQITSVLPTVEGPEGIWHLAAIIILRQIDASDEDAHSSRRSPPTPPNVLGQSKGTGNVLNVGQRPAANNQQTEDRGQRTGDRGQ